MIFIPAIDLIEGRCVRLQQGSYDEVTAYREDPVVVARSFEAAGAQRIHLVDLDAAADRGDNRAVIKRIRAAVRCTLEVGGGVRSPEAVDALMQDGVDYAVIGTVLALDPDAVAGWVARFGARLVAAIDARDGVVRVRGWAESSGVRAEELAARAGAIGMAAVEYTNIANDGTLSGPDIAGTRTVARSAGVPVVLSGGISSLADVERVGREAPELLGVIAGKAIYEGRLGVADAVRALRDVQGAEQ